MKDPMGREAELVIYNPDGTMLWGGSRWVAEYPDAQTWGGNDPEAVFWDDDLAGYDEDLYDEYLQEEFKAAANELQSNPKIPVGSYIEEGVGYGQRCLATKEKM